MLSRYTRSVNCAQLAGSHSTARNTSPRAALVQKSGFSNTLKIEEDGGRYLVALKRSRVPVYTDMEIFEVENGKITSTPAWTSKPTA